MKFIMHMKLIPKKTQTLACFLFISASFTTAQMQSVSIFINLCHSVAEKKIHTKYSASHILADNL